MGDTGGDEVTYSADITTVNVVPSQVVTVLVPTGAPGTAGQSTTGIERLAAIPLSGQRAVATNASGQFIYADKDTIAHAQSTIGITTGAVSAGQSVTAIALGPMTEPSWNWTPGQVIFLGNDGQLTQTPPTTGVLLILGKAVTPTQIFVCVQPGFIRS